MKILSNSWGSRKGDFIPLVESTILIKYFGGSLFWIHLGTEIPKCNHSIGGFIVKFVSKFDIIKTFKSNELN